MDKYKEAVRRLTNQLGDYVGDDTAEAILRESFPEPQYAQEYDDYVGDCLGDDVFPVPYSEWRKTFRPAEIGKTVPMEMLVCIAAAWVNHNMAVPESVTEEYRRVAARYGYTVTESAKEGER